MTSDELAHVRQVEKERKQRARLLLNEEEKEKIRAKDREKRAEARKKLEEEQKEKIKAADKERRATARKNMKEEHKEKARANERERREKMTIKEKDKKKIIKLIRMRKHRLLESDENKKIARNKAKVGMKVLRRDGPIRKYLERPKKHSWAVKWKKFLSQHPMYQELERKKKN